MKRFFIFLFILLVPRANASLINIDFTYSDGKTYKVDIKNLDDLKGDNKDNAINNIKNQLQTQGLSGGDLNALTDVTGTGLRASKLKLSFAGQVIEIVVGSNGEIAIPRDDLGLFDGMVLTGITLNNFDSLVDKNATGNFVTKFKTHLEELTNSGKIYAIFSKLYVRELHRKIAKTPYSVVGGNPLSTMYMLADNDFNLAINYESIDSYSYPQIYYANTNYNDIINIQLPINIHIDFFGLLDPLGLGLRFDMPLSFTQIETNDSEKIIGGNLGLGLALRWILPESWGNWARDWSITPSIKPIVASFSYNDKIKNLDESEILSLDDLSVLPEISIFKAFSIVSKKDIMSTDFGWREDKIKFTLINSITFVDSWSKASMENTIQKFGVLDEKQKHIIPNLDLHNAFFKNGLFIHYMPTEVFTYQGGITLTKVYGRTEVFVPTYWTFNLALKSNITLWLFDNPTFELKYIKASRGTWNALGLTLRMEF